LVRSEGRSVRVDVAVCTVSAGPRHRTSGFWRD
jgi:hypothetical protein